MKKISNIGLKIKVLDFVADVFDCCIFIFKYICGGAIVVLSMLFCLVVLDQCTPKDYELEIQRDRKELHYQGLKDQLVMATDNYIQTVGKGSCLNGLILVEACEDYGVDLKFALAQGHIESHFGTKGIASKTNSVFNVMSFDGLSAEQIIKKGKGYTHPDHSVKPYLKLLTTKYLVDKTEEDMFLEFVNIHGERYASNKNYEMQLLNIYNNIDSIVHISEIYNEYKRYKIILNK